LALALLVAVVPVAAAAAVNSGTAYELAEGDTFDGDLYAFGETVTIAGRVTGDVVAAASQVLIAPTGVVEGDLLAAGQSVVVKGTVNDDVRGAAFTVQVATGGHVGGDLVGVGYDVSAAEGSSIDGDALGAGYQGLFDGEVAKDVTFYGSGFELNGTVGGDVEAHVDAATSGGPTPFMFPMPVSPPRMIQPGLSIAEGSRIEGDLKHVSPQAVTIPQDVVSGETTFEMRDVGEDEEPDQPPTASDRAVGWMWTVLKDFVALLVVGALVILAWPRLSAALTGHLADKPMPSLGWGCLSIVLAAVFAVALPAMALILAAFLNLINVGPLVKPVLAVGILSFALLTIGTYLLSWLGTVVVGNWTGRSLLSRVAPTAGTGRFAPLVLGLAIVAIVTNLPYIGFPMTVIVVSLGLGALVLGIWRSRAALPPAVAPPPTMA
jgi:cytoskeletal protein CcmA (bactofilin family)